MRKPNLLCPDKKIDDSNLAKHSAELRAHAESIGLDGCCRWLADFGVNEQESWKEIRSLLEEVTFREFKKAYSRACKTIAESDLVRATVRETAPGGAMLPGYRWRVQADDGRLLWAVIPAAICTSKRPTLLVGQTVFVRVHISDPEICSINLAESRVKWVGEMKLRRMAAESNETRRDQNKDQT